MEPSFEKKYHAVENEYYWFRARRDMITRFLSSLPPESRIIDIGCSGGVLLEDLSRHGFQDLSGIDISAEAVAQCRRRGYLTAQVADAGSLPFPDNTFDVLIASDVLEHVDDERKTLQEWNRVLKEGGLALIFVPAHQYLWSDHDMLNRHRKRYNKKEFRKALRECGFEFERIGYWNFTLFIPVFFIRILQRITASHNDAEPKDNLYAINIYLNTLLLSIMKIENIFLAWGIRVPIGVSLFSVVRKKS